MQRIAKITTVLLLLWALPSIAVAEIDGIESAKKALQNQPWYDSESDGLKPIVLPDGEEVERADWRGVKRPEWDWSTNWNWGGITMGWLSEIMRFMGWVALVAVLGLVGYVLVKAFMDLEGTTPTSGSIDELEDQLTHEQRVENLPVQLRQKKGDFLQIAREAYEAGNYRDAIIYLFSYRLIQLDRAGCIRLAKGKTNRQYLIEMTRTTDLQKILGQTMVAFEDVFFGKHDLTRERFESCWSRNDQFKTLLGEANS